MGASGADSGRLTERRRGCTGGDDLCHRGVTCVPSEVTSREVGITYVPPGKLSERPQSPDESPQSPDESPRSPGVNPRKLFARPRSPDVNPGKLFARPKSSDENLGKRPGRPTSRGSGRGRSRWRRSGDADGGPTRHAARGGERRGAAGTKKEQSGGEGAAARATSPATQSSEGKSGGTQSGAKPQRRARSHLRASTCSCLDPPLRTPRKRRLPLLRRRPHRGLKGAIGTLAPFRPTQGSDERRARAISDERAPTSSMKDVTSTHARGDAASSSGSRRCRL